MILTVNNKVFHLYVYEDITLEVEFLNGMILLIDGSPERWTAKDIYDRIDKYSKMNFCELKQCDKSRIETKFISTGEF